MAVWEIDTVYLRESRISAKESTRGHPSCTGITVGRLHSPSATGLPACAPQWRGIPSAVGLDRQPNGAGDRPLAQPTVLACGPVRPGRPGYRCRGVHSQEGQATGRSSSVGSGG